MRTFTSLALAAVILSTGPAFAAFGPASTGNATVQSAPAAQDAQQVAGRVIIKHCHKCKIKSRKGQRNQLLVR